MALWFEQVSCGPVTEVTAHAPGGAVIGIVGDDVGEQRALLRVAAGIDRPSAGTVRSSGPARILGPFDALDFSPVDNLMLDHALAFQGPAMRARLRFGLEELRKQGSTILLASHEEPMIESVCDEVWWLNGGRLARTGDVGEVLAAYRKHVALTTQVWSETVHAPLSPRFRRGDGRAELLSIQTLNAEGHGSMVWASGEVAAIRVVVRFHAAVDDPVVGILIRTRIGFEVFGTNTELEKIKLGPVAADETLTLTFRFPCHLCPQQYTVTAASHDPDGVWHDWAEDAVSVVVTDTRYTAGVANLRATVDVVKG